MGWMYPKCTHKFHSENGVRRGFLDIFGWGDFFVLLTKLQTYIDIQGNVTAQLGWIWVVVNFLGVG